MLSCYVALLVVLAGVPAQAQESMVLYDNFEAKFIDPDKWSGAQSGRLLEVVRETEGKAEARHLVLVGRAFGRTSPIPGSSSGRVRLLFTNPAAVTAIKAKVQVRKVEATGCPGNVTPTRAATRLSGFFFKTASVTPPSGINDVMAFVRIERFSNSTDPEGVLQVRARVLHCADVDCIDGPLLHDSNLGTIGEKEETTLRIQWDQTNHEFIFQRDSQPEVFAPYEVSDALDPTIQQKRLEIAHEVANCSDTASAAFMEVRFDDVFVNESPVPSP